MTELMFTQLSENTCSFLFVKYEIIEQNSLKLC